MDLIHALTQLQLTRQEAVIYLLLSTEGELTGYEVAKLSGISRSNTYTALANLVEKGAANVIEDSATRYTPVPIDEFCENKIRELQEIKTFLENNMPVRKEEAEPYITIKGQKHIINKVKNIINGAKERIYISVSGWILDAVLPDLSAAAQRGLKVVLITNPPFIQDNMIVYHSQKDLNQIRLISDTINVLTGEITDSINSTCLFSQKKNLVDLFKESMKNEIKLIEITKKKVKGCRRVCL
ncbi:MAG: helix-turn-helix domain-containing protein [Bacillota bacterium]